MNDILPIKWHHQEKFRQSHLSHVLRHWLLERGSMTKKIKHACQQVKIQVIASRVCLPSYAETAYLGVKPRSTALIREIFMICDGEPWLYGRTVIPWTSLNGVTKRIKTLGETPIGHLLFSRVNRQRTSFDFAQLSPKHTLCQTAVQGLNIQPEDLWARRCIFTINGNNLSLTEVFLPPMVEALT